MSLVYIHRRISNNEVFYVGIGESESRAYSRHKRNKFWNNIYSKDGGFKVEIIKDKLSRSEACETEIQLIKKYGRRIKNKGTLCNLTLGGEGSLGYPRKHSKETKLKMSKAHKGIKKSEDHKRNMKFPDLRKKVKDNINGKIYDSMQEAANSIGIPPSTLSRKLNGKTKKKYTDMVYI